MMDGIERLAGTNFAPHSLPKTMPKEMVPEDLPERPIEDLVSVSGKPVKSAPPLEKEPDPKPEPAVKSAPAPKGERGKPQVEEYFLSTAGNHGLENGFDLDLNGPSTLSEGLFSLSGQPLYTSAPKYIMQEE